MAIDNGDVDKDLDDDAADYQDDHLLNSDWIQEEDEALNVWGRQSQKRKLQERDDEDDDLEEDHSTGKAVFKPVEDDNVDELDAFDDVQSTGEFGDMEVAPYGTDEDRHDQQGIHSKWYTYQETLLTVTLSRPAFRLCVMCGIGVDFPSSKRWPWDGGSKKETTQTQ